ncbi:MAG TPA: hypothetical protein DDZ05_01855 [Candidatus Blackburnbacteria bacterium]|nr:hypothetical protein [Candidatus Blackburnbacteria bacterium]
MVLQKKENSKHGKLKSSSLFAFLLLTIYHLLFTTPVNAQINVATPFNPPLVGPPGRELEGVGKFVSVVLANAYIIAGVLLLFFIIITGIQLISSAGSDDKQKVVKWKATLTTAIIGFLIIFASYWIIQIIELITGIHIL